MPKQLQHLFEFGRFRVDRTERLLFQDGVPLSFPPKLFDTLLILAENRSHVVEKDDHLMQTIWAPNHRIMGRLRGASCNLGDMGTHLCPWPTGEHCPKGLICLGCAHAQRKKCACRSLGACWPATSAAWALREVTKEPAGQIAAREMEIVRIRGRCRGRKN
jgi:hypothetical protein